MLAWTIPIAYVAIWLVYGWRLTIFFQDRDVRERSRYASAREVADAMFGGNLAFGFYLALFWPVVAPVRGAYRLLGARDFFRTPAELEEADREELEKLRKLAKEYGLSMPEVR